MAKQLDFTECNEKVCSEGLLVKKYSDGEVLVKVFFEGMTSNGLPRQDEAEAWLDACQIRQLIEFLEDE